MDSIKRDKHRFNIFDIIVILAIIAVITFAANVIMNDLLFGSVYDIEYIVKLTDVGINNTNTLIAGDKIISGTNNSHIGNVINSEYQAKQSYIFNYETGRFSAVEHEDKYDLFITVRAVSAYENNQYLVNGNTISSNTKINIAVPFYYKDAEIIKVSAVNTEKAD